MGRKKKSHAIEDMLEGTNRDWAENLGPASDLERQRKRRAKLYEIGPIPEPADMERRESCRFDLLKFILTYCLDMLDHPPSEKIINGLIRPLERSILHGGLELPVFGRGVGKTTIVKCAILWALAYGHRRFIVVIAATKEAAVEGIFDECLEMMAGEEGGAFRADFPGLALPIAAIEGAKRGKIRQTVNGRSTGMKFTTTRFRLPAARGPGGEFLEPDSRAAIFIACSMNAALKGLVKKKDRPDLVVIDDPETERQAASRSLTDEAERFINGSIHGLFGKKREPVAVMAITPIREGDLCTRFMDRERHGEWHLVKTPVAEGWSARHDELAAVYKRTAFNADVEAGSNERELSREWYLLHRAEFADIKPVDDQNFTPIEVDAIHHILNEWCRLGDSFAAECQLDVTHESVGETLTAADVRENVNGMPRMMAPLGLTEAVAFVDVNISADGGLRYGVGAFGLGRRAAIIDYGRYPQAGQRLFPVGADQADQESALFGAVQHIIEYLIKAPFTKSTGERMKLRAICFDGGFMQTALVPALKAIGSKWNLGGAHLYWSLGFPYMRYSEDPRFALVSKDHVHSGTSKTTGDVFLAFHADYWREVAQRAYRVKFPLSGSLSLFKPDAAAQGHEQWANESTYERLVRTYSDRDNRGMPRKAWEWFNARKGHNHSLDIAYGLLALAHWEGIYTALAPLTISAAPANESAAPSAPSKPSAKPQLVKRPPVSRGIFKPNPFKQYRPMGGGKR